jgi:beta-lactamase superfamily II metal-dependent hydrolase
VSLIKSYYSRRDDSMKNIKSPIILMLICAVIVCTIPTTAQISYIDPENYGVFRPVVGPGINSDPASPGIPLYQPIVSPGGQSGSITPSLPSNNPIVIPGGYSGTISPTLPSNNPIVIPGGYSGAVTPTSPSNNPIVIPGGYSGAVTPTSPSNNPIVIPGGYSGAVTPGLPSNQPIVNPVNPSNPSAQITPVQPKQNLTLHFLDVGQGDSILVQFPNGKIMLIDAGSADMGTRVTSYLKSLGITTIDALVITHPHEDHIGGMSTVLNNFAVKQVYDIGYPQTTDVYMNLLTMIDQKNIPYDTLKSGDSISPDPTVPVQVLNPPNSFFSDVNDNSLVLKVKDNKVSFLLMGDAGFDAEARLLSNGYDISSDVLKVAHHGSDDATGYGFLSAVEPKISIIEVGPNSYGHPTSEVLQRLQQIGSKIYRTDLNGNIRVTTNGLTYTVIIGKSSTPAGQNPFGTDPLPVVQPTTNTPTVKPTTATPTPTTKPTQPTVIPTPAGQTSVCDCSGNTKNCGDFPDWASANACYDYCISQGKGDVHQLDSDKDGCPCESNKGCPCAG